MKRIYILLTIFSCFFSVKSQNIAYMPIFSYDPPSLLRRNLIPNFFGRDFLDNQILLNLRDLKGLSFYSYDNIKHFKRYNNKLTRLTNDQVSILKSLNYSKSCFP